jgi:hypothetical protein
MGHTKAEKRRLLSAMQSKCAKLYLDQVLSVKDCEAVDRIVKRGLSKLK